ncbi:phiSA1p31-related protein [Streptomyces sp. NPDC088258]|uniref:phiSA1p31-related protein n=1 Tax=Streptomyces sp. NPDC088258 TaxID=3365849 RepID=UPI00382EB5B3
MATYEIDGVVFDLARTYSDVTGIEWTWSGRWTAAGEPIMRTVSGFLPLPDVYRWHGPLIAIPEPVTGRQMRAVFGADFLASQAAGYVESPESWAARVLGGVA